MSDMIVQVDLGSAQQVNSPKFSISHQTQDRTNVPVKKVKTATFDNLDLRKNYVEINGQRYPRYSLPIYYEDRKYIEQYKDLNLFFKDFMGEPILNLFKTHPDVKTKHPKGIMDLRHQPDHITSKKLQLFQEYAADPKNDRFFSILFRRREIELINDESKLIEVEII